MWGYAPRRVSNETLADELPAMSAFPGRETGGPTSGWSLVGSKAPGELLPAPDIALLSVASGVAADRAQPVAAPASQPGPASLFACPSAVLQNMVPFEYPKRLSVLATNATATSFGPYPRRLMGCSEWPARRMSEPASLVKAPSGVELLVDGVDSPTLACGAKQHSLYKTELCRSWEETGTCRYGSKCQFAHGKDELREVPRHPKYKTEICCTFATTGTCPYGRRCRFIHQNGPITAVGAKKGNESKLPGLGAFGPLRRQITDTMAPASRRLPVFVELSMASTSNLIRAQSA